MYKFSIKVQGSAVNPYEIKVYDEPKGIMLRCSCPQGSRANRFCKHLAAVLVGDVTNVVEGEEHVRTLGKMTEGSHWVEKALNHKPAKRIKNTTPRTLKQIYNKYKDEISSMGYVVEYKEYGDAENRKTICVYSLSRGALFFFKKKKILRFSLEYIESVVTTSSKNEYLGIEIGVSTAISREKPWIYNSIEYGDLDTPLKKFLEDVRKSKK